MIIHTEDMHANAARLNILNGLAENNLGLGPKYLWLFCSWQLSNSIKIRVSQMEFSLRMEAVTSVYPQVYSDHYLLYSYRIIIIINYIF